MQWIDITCIGIGISSLAWAISMTRQVSRYREAMRKLRDKHEDCTVALAAAQAQLRVFDKHVDRLLAEKKHLQQQLDDMRGLPVVALLRSKEKPQVAYTQKAVTDTELMMAGECAA